MRKPLTKREAEMLASLHGKKVWRGRSVFGGEGAWYVGSAAQRPHQGIMRALLTKGYLKRRAWRDAWGDPRTEYVVVPDA